MLESRKDIFADERDDISTRLAKHPRQDMLRHVTGTSTISTTTIAGHAASEGAARPHAHARIRRIDPPRPSAPLGTPHLGGADVPRTLTRCSA